MNKLNLESVGVGDKLPLREHVATNVSLFLYNAAVWNPHRIHYDEAYTRDVEHHPGIVIDGPLQGDWLSQCAVNWIGDQGKLIRFSYSNRRAAHLGETLITGGVVSGVDLAKRTVELELFVKNEGDEVIAPGNATVRFSD